MELSSLINQLFGSAFFPFLAVIIIFVFFVFISSLLPSKGDMGELYVNRALKKHLDNDVYYLIEDVTFPYKEGTTQIDHILISKYGVFIIETKNYTGWIFGGINQKQWTQKIYRETYRFQNPIHQNYKHMKVMEEFLGIDKSALYSIIVFAGDAEFKTSLPENVVYLSELIPYIEEKRELKLSEKQVSDYYFGINMFMLERGGKTKTEHNSHVQEIIKRKN